MIKEDFLHYLWKLKKFDLTNLTTTEKEVVEINDFGFYNTDSGPDFFNAKIKIGSTLWVGNVEMHVNSSDWMKHGHQNDKAYNNVILHVVYNNDIKIETESGISIPTLVLKDRIFKFDLKNYKLLRYNKNWIPCEKLLSTVSQISKVSALEKALSNRLINKAVKLEEIFEKKGNDWNEAFYIFLARYFGMKVNADAFEMLADSLPLKIISREKDSLFKIEALLYGQAGMLEDTFHGEYPNNMKAEYLHLKNKYNLSPIPISIWKYSKLRPLNFPTIRLSQLARVLYINEHLFGNVIQIIKLDDLKDILITKVSSYWINHYVFDKESTKSIKKLGSNALNVLIINTVIPLFFLYGTLNNDDDFKQKSISLLLEMGSESNSIINKWKNLGFNVNSAYDSQALLELKVNFCDKHRCLFCPIGHEILNK